MDTSWRTGAVCAAAAFGISVLFGIIGGVGFGTLLLRAAAGAVVFAGLGTGAVLIARRYLPELFSAGSDVPGEGIDIIIPDVNPHASADDSTDESGLFSLSGASDTPGPEGGGGASEEADDLVEELEEIPRTPAGGPGISIRESSDADLEPVEELDVLPDVGELEKSFAAPIRGETRGGGSSGGAADGGAGDPALLAKVVQTILRKEKEG